MLHVLVSLASFRYKGLPSPPILLWLVANLGSDFADPVYRADFILVPVRTVVSSWLLLTAPEECSI
jgi:hypothetical protein